MLTEMRAAFFLFLSLVFFLIIVGVVAMGMVMKPGRWIDRLRQAG
jgi:hypothetical protein